MKRLLCCVLVLMGLVWLTGCSVDVLATDEYNKILTERNQLQENYDKLKSDDDQLQKKYESLVTEKEEKDSDYDTLEKTYESLKSEYEQYKLETADFMKLSEDERAAEVAQAEKNRIEAEEAAAEAKLEQQKKIEAEAKRAEEERLAEEAKGYETGLTYKELSRSPEKYIGKKVKFTGYVLQSMEDSRLNTARMSTKGKYDNVIMIAYDSSILDVRLLEDDKITIYGVFADLYTYEAVLGNEITLPLISVDRIDIK